MLCQSLQHLINERKGKVVFLGSLVELAIVYAHTPPCDGTLRDEFILIIIHYCHASLLGHNLNGANPFTIGHGIDNLSMKEFQNFLFHYLPHVVVEPSLRLSCRGCVGFDGNLMCPKSGANSLEILKRVP
jgi:hypothetical protein